MGVAATLAPKGLGPKNPTKKLAHVGVLLGHMLSQNHDPEISDPEPPLKHSGSLFSKRQFERINTLSSVTNFQIRIALL